jgi:hypothetical protein
MFESCTKEQPRWELLTEFPSVARTHNTLEKRNNGNDDDINNNYNKINVIYNTLSTSSRHGVDLLSLLTEMAVIKYGK